jgi:hypothetical protein
MPDPAVSAVAAAVAGKAAEAAVQAGKEACAALVRLVRDRLGRAMPAAADVVVGGDGSVTWCSGGRSAVPDVLLGTMMRRSTMVRQDRGSSWLRGSSGAP